MDEELVEAVARALCVEDGYDPDKEIVGSQCTGFENFGPLWQANERSENTLGGRNYVRDARAVIPLIVERCAKEAEAEHTDLERQCADPNIGNTRYNRLAARAGTARTIGERIRNLTRRNP